MSKYTTEIRFICETLNSQDESTGYSSINTILTNVHSKVFDFDYPIFDPAYKPVLEKKILKHFYTREIAHETYGRFKLALDSKMNEIMPYYNKLYTSELIDFNPLYDFDETTIGHRTHDDEINEAIDTTRKDTGTVTNNLTGNDKTSNRGTIDDSSSSSSENGGQDVTTREGGDSFTRWDKFSDTPQGTVNNMALNSDGYLTDARHITEDHTGTEFSDTTDYGGTQETNSDSTRTLNTDTTITHNTQNKQTLNTTRKDDTDRKHEYDSIVDYSEHVFGKSRGKSYSKLLEEFRRTFLNIDLLIINELEDLFFQLW